MKFRFLTLVPFIVISFIAGCDRQEPGHSPEFPQATDVGAAITEWPATRASDSGNFSITAKPSASIERNVHFSVEVGVELTEAGKAAGAGDDLEVRVDADMPGHGHGMNTRPEIQKSGDLQYRADGMLFHMAGDWVITVHLTSKAGSEVVAFPVSIE